jgi:hypothetical protein
VRPFPYFWMFLEFAQDEEQCELFQVWTMEPHPRTSLRSSTPSMLLVRGSTRLPSTFTSPLMLIAKKP